MRNSRNKQKYKACMLEWSFLIKLIKSKPSYNYDLYVKDGDVSKEFLQFLIDTCYTDIHPYPYRRLDKVDTLMRLGDGKIRLYMDRDKL